MSTELVVGVAFGLWLVIAVVFLAACRAASLGDAALMNEHECSEAASEAHAGDPVAQRAVAPSRALPKRSRAPEGARTARQ